MSDSIALESASRLIGLAFRHEYDRSRPDHTLDLREATDPPTLLLCEGASGGLHLAVVDVDGPLKAMVVELAAHSVQREPSFDLWLEDVSRRRFLVARLDGAWTLRPLDPEVASVKDALDRPAP